MEKLQDTRIYDQFTGDIKTGFVAAFIGKPGSGKTYLINKLVKELLPAGFFSYIFVCCPSTVEYKNLTFPSQISSDLTPNFVCQMVNKVNLSNTQKKFMNVLLIIDDCITSIKDLEKDPKIISLFFNRRHLLWTGTINIIVSTQKYTMIPAKIRTTITHLAIFSMSPFDCNKILDESIVKFKKSEWVHYIQEIFTTKHAYILINISEQQFLIH